jgi:hypothetical protein
VAHAPVLPGERWREKMLLLTSCTLMTTAAVIYTFSCPSAPFDSRGGADFRGCDFVQTRAGGHTVLSALCCSPEG